MNECRPLAQGCLRKFLHELKAVYPPCRQRARVHHNAFSAGRIHCSWTEPLRGGAAKGKVCGCWRVGRRGSRSRSGNPAPSRHRLAADRRAVRCEACGKHAPAQGRSDAGTEG